VPLDELASSYCRVNPKSSIGHDTLNVESRMAGTWGAWAFIVAEIWRKQAGAELQMQEGETNCTLI
jgi:hypothetical protein